MRERNKSHVKGVESKTAIDLYGVAPLTEFSLPSFPAVERETSDGSQPSDKVPSRNGGGHPRCIRFRKEECLFNRNPAGRQRHRAPCSFSRYPFQSSAPFACLRDLECNSHILRDIAENLIEVAFSPEFGGLCAAHASRLSRQSHPLSSLFKPDRIAQCAKNLKHHVHMTKRTFSAKLGGAGLLGKDVEIEPKSIPGQDSVALACHPRQVPHQLLSLVPCHSRRR